MGRSLTADERRVLKHLVSEAAKKRARLMNQRERWLRVLYLD